ncbi:MAG: hypothetical protein D4R72_05975 [Nitrosopumilales archaeon]|nr:MAG: hypothetical protein D4R72_05975 [Nitrosopumilales archaeon]
MYDIPFSDGLGGLIYFFLGIFSFEVVVSFFFTFSSNGRPISTVTNRFEGTQKFVMVFLILAFLYYIGENFLRAPIIDFFNSKLTAELIPLSVFSVTILAFYSVKVMINSRTTNPTVLLTGGVSLLTICISIYMVLNGNKLF